MILKNKLKPNQVDAIRHIQYLNKFALYMEMGLGKTRTIIEYVNIKNIETVIYYCPVSLKNNVKEELIKQIEDPKIFVENGEETIPEGFRFYIFGIESINSDRVYLALNAFLQNKTDYIAIVDESTYIKSFKAKRAQRIIRLSKPAKYKTVMTGTPITQYYQDIFMQFRFLDPNIIPYRSYYGFCSRYLVFSDKFKGMITGSINTEELISCISPYIFQQDKSCLDLPEKIFRNYWVDMSKESKERYWERKQEFFEELNSIDPDDYIIEIFKLYSDLQKIVSTDIKPRIKALDRLIIEGEKVCIFCKYIESVKLLQEALPSSIVYTGSVSQKERCCILSGLEDINILILTYGVGSHGLNLTMFNKCIFYESNFKYQDRIQAEDRFYRIGQTKPVTYYTIRCNDSIDEKIADNISLKQYIAEEFSGMVSKDKIIKKVLA